MSNNAPESPGASRENRRSAPPIQLSRGTLDPRRYSQLAELAHQAEAVDAHPPLSDQTLVNLRSAHPDAESAPVSLLWLDGQALAGAAIFDPADQVVELVVSPARRRTGIATALLDALEDQGVTGAQAWAHGNHPGAKQLAQRHHYRPVRELWQMRLEHPMEHDDEATAPPTPGNGSEPMLSPRDAHSTHNPQSSTPAPEGILIRTFDPVRDKQAWLRANSSAFAHHPEQGNMSLADLEARMAEPWFDPEGFLVAVRTEASPSGAHVQASHADSGQSQLGASEPEEILGFHWTKVHPASGANPAMGEVYALGVIPEAQGSGLGKVLLEQGLEHLLSQGLDPIMLYVEADNTAAVNLYQKLGFSPWDTDVLYAPNTNTNR